MLRFKVTEPWMTQKYLKIIFKPKKQIAVNAFVNGDLIGSELK